eukprot:SAG31_NODE_28159_length_414_cov_1.733333_1_plen_89_part_10
MTDSESKKDLMRLVVCAVGIIVSFSVWGYMLEFLTSGGKKMSETGQTKPLIHAAVVLQQAQSLCGSRFRRSCGWCSLVLVGTVLVNGIL